MPTLIIAEAGVNHNGSLELAQQLIEVAANAGADFVKFQTFKTEKIISQKAPKADYQTHNTGNATETQFEMVKRLELDEVAHRRLIEHCKKTGIGFLSTAFDLESIDLLADLEQTLFKIPSGEITNLPYLQKIAATAQQVILSTGMATLQEVETALRVLYKGLQPQQITVLHCNTEYPTPYSDVNLRAMLTMQQAFGVQVGYSDHTLGIEVPIAAVALGAVCIEKHFTLSRQLPGPDHRASLEPNELKAMITAIRNVEQALGNGIKRPSPSEFKNRAIARKSIHLATALPKGHLLTFPDLEMKRPGTGISPMMLHAVVGKRITANLPAEHLLTWEDLAEKG